MIYFSTGKINSLGQKDSWFCSDWTELKQNFLFVLCYVRMDPKTAKIYVFTRK